MLEYFVVKQPVVSQSETTSMIEGHDSEHEGLNQQ